MTPNAYQFILINLHKRRNWCSITGILRNGREDTIGDWLTDEQVENMCGTSKGVFKKVTHVLVHKRYPTIREKAAVKV